MYQTEELPQLPAHILYVKTKDVSCYQSLKGLRVDLTWLSGQFVNLNIQMGQKENKYRKAIPYNYFSGNNLKLRSLEICSTVKANTSASVYRNFCFFKGTKNAGR